MASESYQHITTDDDLKTFCEKSEGAKWIGFDTEFVSENRYRPELCLLQVAVDGDYFIVDTMTVKDLSPFWTLLVNGDHVTVAHAAREEFLFCFRASKSRPKKLFDVQLAAGMVGLEYPASYGNLVSRLLNRTIDKGETRTDWRKRPLSQRQIDYALSDVVHLRPLYDKLDVQLNELNRTEWFADEISKWMDHLELSEIEPQWRRVSGISNLNRRALAIVRQLWLERDEEASRQNRSPRRILADDLIVELAKRGSSDIKRLKAIRGFENRVSKSMFERISEAIETANQLPDKELPKRLPRNQNMNLGLLGQFLTTAINVVCRQQSIAPAIVGTANDIRKLAAWRLGMIKLDEAPELSKGWRARMVGDVIDEVLNGTVAIRVGNPKSEMPLELEYLSGDE
ncbi:MAG: HRDC domain-containing protein [Planctomycetota bacterium]